MREAPHVVTYDDLIAAGAQGSQRLVLVPKTAGVAVSFLVDFVWFSMCGPHFCLRINMRPGS
jgi:hypothetical protein